jgi:hypothetical protein
MGAVALEEKSRCRGRARDRSAAPTSALSAGSSELGDRHGHRLLVARLYVCLGLGRGDVVEERETPRSELPSKSLLQKRIWFEALVARRAALRPRAAVRREPRSGAGGDAFFCRDACLRLRLVRDRRRGEQHVTYASSGRQRGIRLGVVRQFGRATTGFSVQSLAYATGPQGAARSSRAWARANAAAPARVAA